MKEILIGLIPTIIALGTPALIRTLHKRATKIKNEFLRDITIETLNEVDMVFSGKNKIDKFIHTAEISKNKLLETTTGLDNILAKNIVKSKNYTEEIQNIFSNYKFESKLKKYENFQFNDAVDNPELTGNIYFEAETDFDKENLIRAGIKKNF